MRTRSVRPSVAPTTISSVARRSCGKNVRVDASEPSSSEACSAPFASGITDRSVHGRMRAKPWIGASGAPAFGPNHGKQTGTPPRIGLPLS